jgi:DNA adenine methylase
MRLPLFIVKTGGCKSWFVPHALDFLGDSPWPKTIVEPFAGSGVVGLSLLNEGCAERLVLAEKDKDYLAFWRAALGDSNFSYRVRKWTERVLDLPFAQQKPFVLSSLTRMKQDDPGFWILLRSRIGFNGKKKSGFMTDKSRGGILCRWPRSLVASLDLLYSLRNKITVMEDGFEALSAFDSEDSYAFVDPPYTLTENCPGHQIYDEAVIDHGALLATLAAWKGRWQLTYNKCVETFALTTRFSVARIAADGTEQIVKSEEGALWGVPDVDSDFVQMTSGLSKGGSNKKWELVVSKWPRQDTAQKVRSPIQVQPRRASSKEVPTFAYPGGKAKLAKRIAAMLPSGKRFVEPFAGRGNIYFQVAALGMYDSYWLNDLQTAPFLNTLRIAHILSVPKPGKESLYKYRAVSRDETKSPLSRKHALLLEPYLCWNGGKYGQSGGTRRGTQAGYYKKLRLASDILRSTDAQLTRLDYRDVLAQCGEADVVYLDPPYINANVKAYTEKTLDHRQMVEILKNANFKWVLSEYEQPLYIEAFGEPVLRIPVKRGMGKPNGGSKGQKEAVECFWTNFAVA